MVNSRDWPVFIWYLQWHVPPFIKILSKKPPWMLQGQLRHRLVLVLSTGAHDQSPYLHTSWLTMLWTSLHMPSAYWYMFLLKRADELSNQISLHCNLFSNVADLLYMRLPGSRVIYSNRAVSSVNCFEING